MPVKPKKPCRQPGCPELVDTGYCDRHKKQEQKQYDERRGSSTERGYDARWRRYRLMYLRRNPLCVMCEDEGKLTPATVVDHITPHKGNYELFWDETNHQSLCAHHHNVKTAKEDGRWG